MVVTAGRDLRWLRARARRSTLVPPTTLAEAVRRMGFVQAGPDPRSGPLAGPHSAACTPPSWRLFGYYALPLLWGDAVIGWANVALLEGRMDVTLGYAEREPGGAAFRRALDAELGRLEQFLAG